MLVILIWTIFVLTLFELARAVPLRTNIHKMTPDEETGKRIAQWTKEMNVNPEELGSYFQGDIMITRNPQRNGLKDESTRWPNKTIPYVITGNFSKYFFRKSSAILKYGFLINCIILTKGKSNININLESKHYFIWNWKIIDVFNCKNLMQ